MFFDYGYDDCQVDALCESSRLDGEVQGMEIGIKMGREDGIRKGREEGRHDSKIEIAKKLIHLGLSPENIANTTELSREEIANIQD